MGGVEDGAHAFQLPISNLSARATLCVKFTVIGSKLVPERSLELAKRQF